MPVAFVSAIARSLPLSKHIFVGQQKLSTPSAFNRPSQPSAILTYLPTFEFNHYSFRTNVIPILSLQPNDILLTTVLFTAAGFWLVLWQRLTSNNLVSSSVTRKVIHVSCGPLFVAIWPLYSDAISARVLAATVPLSFIYLLAISGSSREDQTARAALGRAISRQGKAADALEGPFYYSIILLVISLLLFKSPIAVIVVAQLCFGDGAAEIIGRRFGASSPWGFPWTGDKSVVGSIAFLLAALVASCAGLSWWNYWNLADASISSPTTFFSLVVISATCAATELTPKELVVDDNLTVAAAAAMLSAILFGWGPA